MDKTYTHKDLATQLKVSETTIKSYRRKFPGCIPVASRGKPIRFNAQALTVAKKIRDLFERGMSVEEVRSRLSDEFSWIEPVESLPGVMPVSDSGGEDTNEGGNGGIVLSPSFANAISGLAKSVVSLTRQQGEILSRLGGLEESFKNGVYAFPPQQDALQGVKSGLETSAAADTCPLWAGELSSRLLDMEKTLARVLESLEAGLNSRAGQAGDSAESSQSSLSAPVPSAQSEGVRVLPWGDRVEPGSSGSAEGAGEDSLNVSDDYLRYISTLPLVVRVSGKFLGIAGRNPFCLNDLKAVLSQTFSPPHHYGGRWETASGEIWYILEQPEDADAETISLHLRPVSSRKNQDFLEVVRFMLGRANEEPASLYSLVQQLLG